MTEKLLVPDIGDFENVEVIELLVKEGQQIEKNDPVITIESDKSSVEIPSTFSGKIVSILPENVDGISTLDLSLSIVIMGSFFCISCPSLTRSSMTSTFSKSPMSGTNNFSVIFFSLIHHKIHLIVNSNTFCPIFRHSLSRCFKND